MASVPPSPQTLAGAVSTARIIKDWLIDGEETQAGLIGVNDALQIVSVQTFNHPLNQPAIDAALGEAFRAAATGVVVYRVAEGRRPFCDPVLTRRLAVACEANNVTLLDVIIYSPDAPNNWVSARQQGII